MSTIEKSGKTETLVESTPTPPSAKKPVHSAFLLCIAGLVVTAVGVAWWFMAHRATLPNLDYRARLAVDNSGLGLVNGNTRWDPNGSLEEIANAWRHPGHVGMKELEKFRSQPLSHEKVESLLSWCSLANYEGEPRKAYDMLCELRGEVQGDSEFARDYLFTIIYYQGLTALRCGETENCVLCRGESSCIMPISPAAVHTKPQGSRHAIEHCTEYLGHFPKDLEVRWLLNVAHMTLNEYPNKVDPQYLISLDQYFHNEFDMGKFRDISHDLGLERLNMAGGGIMDDFDNDGLLDLVATSMDPTQPMAFYRNKGDGTFEDRTEAAGLLRQFGGINCSQADYNNDGYKDILILRGSWILQPMPLSLLRNNGNGTFTDVTREAGLGEPTNSHSGVWADFDNDGFVDLFLCCELQPNRLYHNKGDGTFEEVAVKAGVQGRGEFTKAATWLDFDNDGYPDLFVNNIKGPSQLFHNNRDGTFSDVTLSMGIKGPFQGYTCWAFDFDNDGWIDIFATSYARNLPDVIYGMTGQPHSSDSNKLYRNLQGKGFQDVTKEAGLDQVFSTMGANFGDFDGDGFLDFYLGTGDPNLYMIVPNRMFKNVAGKRFSEVTTSSGTGHLQKGHGTACGDWRRDGNIDIFMQFGGAVPGDLYHNVLFQNPGHDNQWLTVKLVGKKTNRAAMGARIKVVTAGDKPLTIHRHVTPGGNFGGSPLQQTIGLGKADKVAQLEIYWPASGTTQTFHDLSVNQAIEVTEFANGFRKLDWQPIKLAQSK